MMMPYWKFGRFFVFGSFPIRCFRLCLSIQGSFLPLESGAIDEDMVYTG